MKFFSGFALKNEASLFSHLLKEWENNPYVVAGFSYGAIEAFEYTLKNDRRIDRLILLSPAWFLDKDRAFVRTQLIYFKKDPQTYLDTFFQNAVQPANIDLNPYRGEGDAQALQKLLTYPWEKTTLQSLQKRGIKLQIFLGAKDRIIDATKAHDHFKNFGESWLFKAWGHFLG